MLGTESFIVFVRFILVVPSEASGPKCGHRAFIVFVVFILVVPRGEAIAWVLSVLDVLRVAQVAIACINGRRRARRKIDSVDYRRIATAEAFALCAFVAEVFLRRLALQAHHFSESHASSFGKFATTKEHNAPMAHNIPTMGKPCIMTVMPPTISTRQIKKFNVTFPLTASS
jgi:lysylphosphatidylglycerol synthetase-like protein (DUF2156 family)